MLRYRHYLLLLCCCICWLHSTLARNKYNISYAELHSCKEYDIGKRGYIYQDFFIINTMGNNKIAADERLHLKFFVIASMDAHILLTDTDLPRPWQKVYEIVIGAGANTFSTIRTTMGRTRVATNQDSNILSPFDPTPIEIVQKTNGTLSVYIPGLKEAPLITYNDTFPLNIKFLSFSSFGMIYAKWFYDCQLENGFDQEIVEEVRVQTPKQRLISALSARVENTTVPANLTSVRFEFEIGSVKYDDRRNILKSRLNIGLNWVDPTLAWNPENFNGTDNLRLLWPMTDFKSAIWVPHLKVLNAASADTLGRLKLRYELLIDYRGNVSLYASNAELSTWCPYNNKQWPQDKIDCQLQLGLVDINAEANKRVTLYFDSASPLPSFPISILSEWKFVQVNVFTEIGKVQMKNVDVNIELVLRRNSRTYKMIFGMPAWTCQILFLLSFLLRGYRRGALILLVFVIQCLGLMFMTCFAPTFYIPSIMIAYQNLLRLVSYCYILHIVIMWLEMFPPKDRPHSFIMLVLDSSKLRFLLGLRLKDVSESTDFVNAQEHPWREIAKVLNNLSCIVIAAIFLHNNVFYMSHM